MKGDFNYVQENDLCSGILQPRLYARGTDLRRAGRHDQGRHRRGLRLHRHGREPDPLRRHRDPGRGPALRQVAQTARGRIRRRDFLHAHLRRRKRRHHRPSGRGRAHSHAGLSRRNRQDGLPAPARRLLRQILRHRRVHPVRRALHGAQAPCGASAFSQISGEPAGLRGHLPRGQRHEALQPGLHRRPHHRLQDHPL